MKGSKTNALSPELEHGMILNLASPGEENFLPYQFKLPGTSKQYPRKNKFRLKYKINNWSFDTSRNNSLHSPNSSLDYNPCYTYNSSIRILSRSAKIMRALSSTHNSFRHENVGIRKLLNFDSTPSPKENSSYESSLIDPDTPLTALNSSLSDSTDSNVPTVESIDENQNQTPQNRKHVRINKANMEESPHGQSRTSYIMSLLEKERTDTNANHGRGLPSLCSFNQLDRSNGSCRVIIASTPRNLAQEFEQEVPSDRPHTPENIINVIPESISAIKKSHKKEKLYCHEEQSSTQRTDVLLKRDSSSTMIESSKIDVAGETNVTSESESQKKYKSIKRTLIYNVNNECLNTTSESDNGIQYETSIETDSLESGFEQIESDEMLNIESESHEKNMQIDENDKKNEGSSKEDVCAVSRLSLLEESSGICNVNVTNEKVLTSPESSSHSSQDAHKVVTPENHINMLKHVLTESIKKSHKKIKHGNRKKLFNRTDAHEEMELEKSAMSLDNVCNDDNQDIKNQTVDTTCSSSPCNLEFNRPNTPENVNSSRLLLHDFDSVKKSHKKDKRSKRTYSFAERYDREYQKKNNLLQRNEENNVSRISHRNESFGLQETPDASPKEKKKSRSMLYSSTPKMKNDFTSLGCNNIDEFKIYTPIKKPILLTVTNYLPTDELLLQEDESVQRRTTSKEIDYSRCITPIARFKELRKNEEIASKRDNTTGCKTDTSIPQVVDTANVEDKNGRSTPINMSTMELLYNKDSIKKSHKKDKHNHSKRPTSEKKRLYMQESEHHVNFVSNEKMLDECAALSLKHRADNCSTKVRCTLREKENVNNTKTIDYDDPQPSTSREADNIENTKNISISKFLNSTPPNSSSVMNLMKLRYTTSIKKSHKKERDMNAQTKYIFMDQEHELSDDGSIFDEEDKLNFMDINDNSTETKI
ncbi:hypothetical protein PUN28_007744 [Cardiocondyla obscurior]|uniref:Uncharacterized protein n=1 Tax=Cardiocondyla obscurior TaxID=286306 RepID=A0AAW2FUJ9_9HYME